jgi:hypothetical protein
MGQTLQSYVLVREKSCLCLLPAPFNLATTILLPMQYILRNKGLIIFHFHYLVSILLLS